MNNVIYGQRMENVRNRVDTKHVNDEKDCLKWTSKPAYVTQKIFDNNLVVIHKINTPLMLNKSAYVGMYILALIEVPMYEFYYD